MSTSQDGSSPDPRGSAPPERAELGELAQSAESAQPAESAAPAVSAGASQPAYGSAPSGEPVHLPDFVAALPEQIWYLTASGQEMWCRRPYGFFFSTSEAASAFARALGSAFELSPIGVNSKELVSREAVEAMRQLGVHRLFIDPRIDSQSGDVFGRILRLEPAGPLQ